MRQGALKMFQMLELAIFKRAMNFRCCENREKLRGKSVNVDNHN